MSLPNLKLECVRYYVKYEEEDDVVELNALQSMILFLLKEYLLGGLFVESETGSMFNTSINIHMRFSIFMCLPMYVYFDDFDM